MINYTLFRNKILKSFIQIMPLEKVQVFNNDLILIVKPKNIYNVLLFLKYHTQYQFTVLTCISAVDYPANKYRFKIAYELLSIKYNLRIRVKTFSHELFSISSCDSLFLAATWHECEAWDMFGIFFKNSSHLRRILTDYGFEGYPLRKDFPLSGFIEMRYNEIEKRVVSESLELSQEFRTFNFLSPWSSF